MATAAPIKKKKGASRKAPSPVCKSTVKMSVGDHMSDTADVHVELEIPGPDTEREKAKNGSLVNPFSTTSMIVRLPLPEGSVSKDSAAAKKLARAECAALLRRLASQVVKG